MVASVTALVITAAGAQPAQAAPLPAKPPHKAKSLNGESFNSPSVQIANIRCNLSGSSTFDFSASGEASGPYPGTFEERGTVVIGPQTHTEGQSSGAPFPDAAWTSINATFTITASDGSKISGTKRLADSTYNFPYNEVVCATFPNPTAPAVTSGHAYGGTSDKLTYMTKLNGTGNCTDKGTGYVTFVDADYMWMGQQVFNQFFESFTSKSGDQLVGCNIAT